MSRNHDHNHGLGGAQIPEDLKRTMMASLIAFERWKETLTDKDLARQHFSVEGEQEQWERVFAFVAEHAHGHLHEAYGNCEPEEGQEGPSMNDQLLRLAFMLGRSYEENSIMELHQRQELDLPIITN